MKRPAEILLATLICGISFAGAQFLGFNFIGPYLTDIIASIAAITALIVFFGMGTLGTCGGCGRARSRKRIELSAMEILIAWSPYALLVVLVLVWG